MQTRPVVSIASPVSRRWLLAATVLGIIIGTSWSGLYVVTPSQSRGVWRTNRITGSITFCTVQRESPDAAFGGRFINCV